MARKHALFVSLVVAAALLAGVFAALRTTELGASAATPTLSDTQISTSDRQLDRIQARLDRQGRKRPPRLPALRPSSDSGGGPTMFAVSSGSGSSGSGSIYDEHLDDHDHDPGEDRVDEHDRGEHGGRGHGRDEERGYD